MTASAKDKVMQARTNLVLGEPFFGFLLMRMKCQEDKTCETFWTDGRTIGFNPDYVKGLSLAEVEGVLCHEVLHVANGHPWRRDGREHEDWNEDCDYAINPIVIDSGLALPRNVLLDPRFKGKSAEEIHGLRLKKQKGGQDGQDKLGKGKGQGQDQNAQGGHGDDTQQGSNESSKPDNGPGEVRDFQGSAEEKEQAEAESKVAVIQAANIAQGQGRLPGGMAGLIDQIKHPPVDWRSALLKFVQMSSKADFSWRSPNRRYLGMGLYLPELRSEQLGPVVVAVDTSGSCWGVLDEFAGALQGILDECKPEKISAVYSDAAVCMVREYEPGDDVTLETAGGGGTSFCPVFDWVREEGIEPACLIYLTDMDGTFPSEAPDYPVLWAKVGYRGRVAPFGEALEVRA